MLALPSAQRLDLRAHQHDPCLVGINDLVVEARLAVFRDDLLHHALAAFGCHGSSSFSCVNSGSGHRRARFQTLNERDRPSL